MGKGFYKFEPTDPNDLFVVEPNLQARKALLTSFAVEGALGVGWLVCFASSEPGYSVNLSGTDVAVAAIATAAAAGGLVKWAYETMYYNALILSIALCVAKSVVLHWKSASFPAIAGLAVYTIATLLQTCVGRAALGGERKKLPATKVVRQLLQPYFMPKGWRNKTRAAATYGCLIGAKIANLYVPLQIGYIVSDVTSGVMPYKAVLRYALLILLVRVLKEAQSLLYVKVKQAAFSEMSDNVFRHLHSLSLEWHLRKKIGNVVRSMDRGTQAANTVVESLFLSLAPTVVECFVTFAIFYQHFGQPELAAVCLVSFTTYLLTTYSVTLLRKKFREDQNEHDNDYHAKATESLVNFETVKYFTAEERERKSFLESVETCQKYGVTLQAASSALSLTQQVIIYSCSSVCMLVAAGQILQDPPQLDIGDFVAINGYITQLFAPLAFLGAIYGTVIQALVNMKHLADLLTEQPDVVDAAGAKALELPAASLPRSTGEKGWKGAKARPAAAAAPGSWFFAKKATPQLEAAADTGAFHAVDIAGDEGECSELAPMVPQGSVQDESADEPAAPAVARGVEVEFRSVSFKYPSADAGAGVKDVSFKIGAGQKLALVGPTGSGKTTLSRLLFRFYDADAGGVYVNGQDIAGVQQASLRAAIGIVPQDTVLFNDTIRNNVKYGRPTATDAELEQAARDAKLDTVIQKLPEGWDTVVGERGLRLSGGEKQRVAIARCLVKDPPVIVLDEATSALDSTTEKEILDVLQCLKGRTLVVIAHRLSTVQDADVILVLKNGAICESGTHEQLLDNPTGVYTAMWQTQANRDPRHTPPPPLAAPAAMPASHAGKGNKKGSKSPASPASETSPTKGGRSFGGKGGKGSKGSADA